MKIHILVSNCRLYVIAMGTIRQYMSKSISLLTKQEIQHLFLVDERNENKRESFKEDEHGSTLYYMYI